MKKKVIVLGVISLFVFSGLSMFTAMGYELHKTDESYTNEMGTTAYDPDYPDLIPKLYLEQKRNHYDIYVEVQNAGNNQAELHQFLS